MSPQGRYLSTAFRRFIPDNTCSNLNMHSLGNLTYWEMSQFDTDLYHYNYCAKNLLRGLVVRVPSYRTRGSASIPGAIRFSEM
jgi:hypothetical protein